MERAAERKIVLGVIGLLLVVIAGQRMAAQDMPVSTDSVTAEAVVVGVRKGPYLIYPGDNTQMMVLWQLDSPLDYTLRWGQDTSYSEGSAVPTMRGDNQYEHVIAGLTPGAKYYYEVEGVGSGSFLAAPPADASDVKFMLYADTQQAPDIQDALNAEMIFTYTTDPAYQTFMLRTGDWVNTGNSESDWTNLVFNRSYSNIIELQANLPMNGCIGNHEGDGAMYDKYWPYPYESGGRYWSFDYGPAHIAVLELTSERESLGEAQRLWLEADLTASSKQWKFLQFHCPVYSAGGRHPNNMNEQAFIQSLCETYGVAIVFVGHNHYYCHCDVRGVKHITSGSAGTRLRVPDLSYDPSIVTALSEYIFCKVDISGLRLDFEAVSVDGTVIDTFTLGIPSEAHMPTPADYSSHQETWMTLSWNMGAGVVSHDVYFGENFDDVNRGTSGTFQRSQTETSFTVGLAECPYPDGLVPDTTYYWRIDEVNDMDPNSPYKGDVWRFNVLSHPGLVGWWKLDEIEGSIAYDGVWNYDAILNGDPLWQPASGQRDGALAFDGIDDYVSTPFILNPADSAFSVFAWANGAAPGQVVISQQNGANWLTTDAEGKLMTELQSIGRDSRPLQSEAVIADGLWHRIGLMWDGSNRTLCVDGVVVAEDTQSSTQSSVGSLCIGVGKGMEPGSFFSGLIDDVRIYDVAVSVEKIEALAAR
ncbi:MAG: metallophosphoesterase [Phycisphaerales bacterium]|nr:MAG: metallophosphoesterase [Phycisphaerales bacterium]